MYLYLLKWMRSPSEKWGEIHSSPKNSLPPLQGSDREMFESGNPEGFHPLKFVARVALESDWPLAIEHVKKMWDFPSFYRWFTYETWWFSPFLGDFPIKLVSWKGSHHHPLAQTKTWWSVASHRGSTSMSKICGFPTTLLLSWFFVLVAINHLFPWKKIRIPLSHLRTD